MTITLQMPPEEEQAIQQRAASRGQDVGAYVHQLIVTEMKRPISILVAAEPFTRAVEASGVSDEGFDALIEESIREVRAERRQREQS